MTHPGKTDSLTRPLSTEMLQYLSLRVMHQQLSPLPTGRQAPKIDGGAPTALLQLSVEPRP